MSGREAESEVESLLEDLHAIIHGLRLPVAELENLHAIYMRLKALYFRIGR